MKEAGLHTLDETLRLLRRGIIVMAVEIDQAGGTCDITFKSFQEKLEDWSFFFHFIIEGVSEVRMNRLL